jgi:hypothetical protein
MRGLEISHLTNPIWIYVGYPTSHWDPLLGTPEEDMARNRTTYK